MTAYLVRRLGTSLLLLWGVATLTFLLLHLAPGDPIPLLLDPSLPAQDIELLRHRFGLDRSLSEQYLAWLSALVQGDFGISLRQQRPVLHILRDAIPITLLLSGLGLVAQYTIGIGLGILAATRRRTWFERSSGVSALILYSLPIFWLGLMAQLVFSAQLGWLPSGGLPRVDVARDGVLTSALAFVRHLVMPVLVLGVSGAAGVARVLRASLIEVLGEDYIRTARAKGLSGSAVVLKHALRNACIPLLSLLGLSLPFLMGGSVVTEIVFSWPGMGRVAVDAMNGRDIPVILATTVGAGSLVILGSLLADLAYAWADPRIRTSGGKR